MRSLFPPVLSLLFSCTVSAQVSITAGTQFSLSKNVQLTLDNTDLINNGNFISGNSITTFRGNASSSIRGNNPVQFFALELDKTNNTLLMLQQHIGVSQRLLFSSGFLNLNGFNADLGTTGFLQNEKETSRAIGPNGGEILFTTILNAPVAANPGNLGAVITSSQNLGNVIVKRGHESQQIGGGASNSLFRYYDIIPANNSNLNATLRFNYFDGELDTLNESSLVFFKSVDSTHWVIQGFTSSDPSTNYVERSTINSFSSWWTLSNFFAVLSTHFISFNVRCNGDNVNIAWKTQQEQNSSYFNIEKSTNGIDWRVIGNLAAARNSSNERSYFFTDNERSYDDYYRVSEHDADGKIQYTQVIRSRCFQGDKFKVWPNPFRNIVFVNINANSQSQALIKFFDGKGALVKTEKGKILPGNNQFRFDLTSLPDGVYLLQAEWNNSEQKKSILLVKQR